MIDMGTIEIKIETTGDFLQKFYRFRGIGDNDLKEKWRAMNEHVRIPNFDYARRIPALYELEKQYLADNGFNV